MMAAHRMEGSVSVADTDPGLAAEQVHAAVGALREDAAEQQQAATVEAAGVEAERKVDDRARRYWFPRIVIASAVAAGLAVAVVLAIFGPQLTALRAADADQIAESAEIRQLISGAEQVGEEANAVLAAQDRPTVPIPTAGTVPDSDILVAAATAQVLASLPPAAVAAPSPAALAAAVGQYIAANPITPLEPSTVAIQQAVVAVLPQAVADYLAANPPAPGEDGEDGTAGENGQDGGEGPQGPQGEPGPPPTAEQIQAALVDFLADNPNVLCPRGGTFTLVSVLTTSGMRDLWTCDNGPTPPAPDPEPDDGMDDDADPDDGTVDLLGP